MNTTSHLFRSWVKNVFNRSAGQYGQVGPAFFAFFGKTLADQAGVTAGERILDLACGRGSSLIPARARLGPNGLAVGVDLASEMLQMLTKGTESASRQKLNLGQMDAMYLGFAPEIFDVVQCGLALFFIPDLPKTLREVQRVLKPGGRLVASTYGERDERWAPLREIAEAFEDQVAEVPEVDLHNLNTNEEIIATFERAGFEEVEVVSITREFYFSDEQEWWQTMWSHGGRGWLERMDERVLAAYQAQAFEFLAQIKDEQGIPDRLDVLVSRARKPE